MTYQDHLRVARASTSVVRAVRWNHLDPAAERSAKAALLANPQRIRVLPGRPVVIVLTEAGLLISGGEVPEDYQPYDHEVVHVGLPVRHREVTAAGAVVFDWDGRQGTHLSANGWTYNEHDDSGAISELEVVP